MTFAATIAFIVGIVGTAFITGSVFAINAGLFIPMLVLGVPGLIGWVMPYLIYTKIHQKKVTLIEPIIQQKYDELYEITKDGNHLLTK